MNKHLIPREHGAYAELGFPLLTGLLVASPGGASFLFVAAALLFFFANESVVVLAGARGKRLQQEQGPAARKLLAVLGALGGGAGLAALVLASDLARALCLVPAGFALCLVPTVLARNLKTLSGETIAAAAFSSMHLPVAAAGGAQGALLWGPPVMWFVATMAATFVVHAIKSRVTGATPWVVPVSALAAPLALAAALFLAWALPPWRAVALAACLPLAGALLLDRLALSPRKLKQVGWTVVAANALAVTVLITR